MMSFSPPALSTRVVPSVPEKASALTVRSVPPVRVVTASVALVRRTFSVAPAARRLGLTSVVVFSRRTPFAP